MLVLITSKINGTSHNHSKQIAFISTNTWYIYLSWNQWRAYSINSSRYVRSHSTLYVGLINIAKAIFQTIKKHSWGYELWTNRVLAKFFFCDVVMMLTTMWHVQWAFVYMFSKCHIARCIRCIRIKICWIGKIAHAHTHTKYSITSVPKKMWHTQLRKHI